MSEELDNFFESHEDKFYPSVPLYFDKILKKSLKKLDLQTINFMSHRFGEIEGKIEIIAETLTKNEKKVKTDPYNVIKQIARDKRRGPSSKKFRKLNSEEMLQSLLTEEEKVHFERKRKEKSRRKLKEYNSQMKKLKE